MTCVHTLANRIFEQNRPVWQHKIKTEYFYFMATIRSISNLQCVLTGDCAAGHWCVSGVDRPYPNSENHTVDGVACYNWAELGYGGECMPEANAGSLRLVLAAWG